MTNLFSRSQWTNNRKVIFWLAVILLLAALLRFYGLGIQSLWNDELSSWRRSNYANLQDVIELGARRDVHPPGYHFLLFFVIRYLGDSAVILRLPSAVAGLLAVAGVFTLGRRLYGDDEGLIAAAFTAVSWTPIFYSQEARAYSLLLLFSIVTAYLWMDLVKGLAKQTPLNRHMIIGYILSSIVTAYLHYFGTFLIALQGIGALFFFVRKRNALYQWFLVYCLIGWAYLPWVPTFQEHLSRGPTWIQAPKTNAFIRFLRFLFNESAGLVLMILTLFAVVLALELVAIIISNDKRMALKRFFYSPSLFLAMWFIVPFILVYVKSLISTPVLSNRNLIITLPAAYLLLARAITRLPFKTISRPFVTSTFLVALMVSLFFGMNYYGGPQKGQFREPVAYVEDKEIAQEDSLVIAYAWHKAYFDYYFEKMDSVHRVDLLAGHVNDIHLVEELVAEQEPQFIWFMWGQRKPDPEFLDFLKTNYDLQTEESFQQAGVWLFEN